VTRFVRGSGSIPRGHAWIPQTTFERGEEPMGKLPGDVAGVLERYYLVKLQALQFCGPVHFHFGVWEGIEALCLTFPVIMWLYRILSDVSPAERIERALCMVDNYFGNSPVLGSLRQRLGLRVLARRGELQKLITWYGR
jgi:hypothetical protein